MSGMKFWLPVLFLALIGCGGGVSEAALTDTSTDQTADQTNQSSTSESSQSTNQEPVATPESESTVGTTAPSSASSASLSTTTDQATSSASTGTTIASTNLTTRPSSESSNQTATTVQQTQTTLAPATTQPTTTTPPRNQPDCSSGCRVVLEGDSLTKGLGSRVCNRLDTSVCVNSGISGARVDEMINTARNDVDNLANSNKDVLVLFGGTNDLWQEAHSSNVSTNARETHSLLSEYVADRKAAGWDYIFIATIPAMRPSIEGVSQLNSLIRGDLAGADELIDLGAEPRFADPFDPAYRNADGVHFVDGGADIISFDYFVPAIRG